MDEDSNQSSRNSQQQTDPMDESKHRESDSQMTLTYDSDSEMHGEDTLRIDESDDGQQLAEVGSANPLPVGILSENSLSNDRGSLVVSPFELEIAKEPRELPSISSIIDDGNSEEELTFGAKSRKKISQLIDSESEEEQNRQKKVVVQKPTKKVSNIIDSDYSDDPVQGKQLDRDSDEDLLKKQNKEVDAIGEKIEKSMNRFKSLIDSDSASPINDSDGESKKKKKKLKTKKERGKGKGKSQKDGAYDLLASLNLDFSDEDSRPGRGSTVNFDEEGSSGSTDSRSGNDSESRKKRDKRSTRTPDKKPQRMSAKAAMEQMQVIQSESQRMAREAAVSVPYHRPKQHTLQEFLSRRTVYKPSVGSYATGGQAMGRRKAAADIKMTPEQLTAYAKQLDEREKEAMEFFKSESDEDCKEQEPTVEATEKTDVEMKPVEEQVANETAMDEETKVDDQNEPQHSVNDAMEALSNEAGKDTVISAPMDTELGETLRVSDTEEDALDALINKTHENAELLLASQAESDNLPSSEQASVIEMETEPIAGPSKETPLIDYDIFSEPTPSKLAQKKAELLSDGFITSFPTLKGDPNMMIDLDSGDVNPKTPSGPDILFQRFAKCSGKKAQKAANLNILSTDKGVVEMSTVSLGLEQEERNPNGKEPVPGAAYQKLKQSLWEKMEQARREAFRKRLEGIQQAKKLDDEEEEDEEEILENDELLEDEEDEEEDNDQEEAGEAKRSDLLDDEADEDDDEVEETDQVAPEEEPNEDDDEDSSDEDSEEESKDEPAVVDGEKRKSRIIAAFEDSDEEAQGKEEAEPKEVQKTTTEELFSTLEGNDKFTPSDRNNLETGENMTLLWKDTEEPDTAGTQAEDDLLALCSGQFGETQVPPSQTDTESLATTQPMTGTLSDLALTESDHMTAESERPRTTTDALFTQNSEHQVDDGELLALCSGTFATQHQKSALETEPLPSEAIAKGKLVIVSSDEEDQERDVEKKKKKKRKRRNINISDDEESAEDTTEAVNEHDEEVVLDWDDDEEPERFVDYDSEENEVEVIMTKKDKQKVASAFVDKEAELSESEWGSADEDEKDLDRYDIELGDDENFDQHKLQQEVERIHFRRMLEQDKKEVKTLQDMFFEDEEKDGVGRERQFRWRNTETTFSLDYDKTADDEQREDGDGSDGEAEAQWRKMRYEREMLLKEKKIDLDKVDLTGTLLDKSMDEDNENNSITSNTNLLVAKRKINIVRTKKSSEVKTPQDSPFLITKSSIVQGHKASFLSRDEDTLNKLASLVKVNPETDGTNKAVAAKGRNFVFAAVSPAVDKMGSKRSLDADMDESAQSAKKTKTGNSSAIENGNTKKRLLLGQLM